MDLGVSPLTHTIFAGKSKPLPSGKGFQWVGKKTDITDKAIKAVFEHMYMKAEETGFFEISIDGYGSMTFERTQASDGRE